MANPRLPGINTAGLGDNAGLYLGAQRMNAALMDRFMLVEMDYPTAAEEMTLLAQTCPKLPQPLGEKMIEVANEIRRLFQGDEENRAPIEITCSTRTVIRWAYLTLSFKDAPRPLAHALDRALLYRAEPETRAAIHGIVQRVFGESGDG